MLIHKPRCTKMKFSIKDFFRYNFRKTKQILIWTLASNIIRTHPLFQKIIKIYLVWKAKKNTLGKEHHVRLLPI